MADTVKKTGDAGSTRRNLNKKRGNKENAQPAYQSKSSVKNTTGSSSVIPLHLKSNEREKPLAKGDGFKNGKSKMETVKSSSEQPPKKFKAAQKVGTQGVASDATKRQTLSRAFLTQQVVKHRQLVAEVTKSANPPAAVPTAKSAPGMYKGRVVQSKIGSIWKSSVALGGTDQTSTARPLPSKVKSKTVETLAKTRSKSVADLPRRVVQQPKPGKSNSVSDGFPPVSSYPITNRQNKFCHTSTATAAAAPSSSRTNTVPKGKGTQGDKAKVQVTTDRKVSKPPVSSSISQYRISVETAEERRSKLAEWLASKGKSLKRPAMATAAPRKTKVDAKPQLQTKSQIKSCAEPQHTVQHECESNLHSREFSSAVPQPEDEQTSEKPAHVSTPQIMNTTRDLLDNSDVDLPVDPEFRMYDTVVVNLCDALAALETPSSCGNEPLQIEDGPDDVEKENTPKTECREELLEEVMDGPGDMEVKNEANEKESGCQNKLLEEVMDEPGDMEVKNEANEKDWNQKVEKDEVESDADDDDEKGLMEATPKTEEASVVKYSIKTTPYLQSVKKTIEGNTSASRSLRKKSIKDLKFLTPVRRSCRIQRRSSHLPEMLADHDPCVSSLAELVKLDDEANAYIYRKNPALLDDLPDQPEDH
ncbi:cytoskeleton-associated protein 2 [Lampris incognitus]|uniref:cytoskeleton-associated protein 2 n=1 Tax=Lampris incognitus TaxID=2546036 RepID=UPI0024B4A2BC|nr:cytoskeleton-associated protein 2 [Lampris incognitus]